MRIVSVTTVGAFLLSMAIAEKDESVGQHGQQGAGQHPHSHNPRSLRPIILEPVVKFKSESNPFDWLVNMFTRIMEPPKPPPVIGPLNLPGMNSQIFIRQTEEHTPWESNHVVIKMVTRDPIIRGNAPLGPPQNPGNPQDHYQSLPSSHNYRANTSGRSNHNFRNHNNNNNNNYQRNQNNYNNNYNNNFNNNNNFNGNNYNNNNYNNNFNRNNNYNNFNKNNNYNNNNNNYNNNYNNNNNFNNNNNYNNWRPGYAQNSKPPYRPSPNDFRHDDYSKNPQEPFNSRPHPGQNYQESVYQRSQPTSAPYYHDSKLTGEPASPTPDFHGQTGDQIEPVYGNNEFSEQGYKGDSLKSHRDFYPPIPDSPNDSSDNDFRGRNYPRVNNLTDDGEHSSPRFSPYESYREVVRNDRMVTNGHRQNFNRGAPYPRYSNFRNPGGFTESPFRHGPMTKFQLEDVGGLEVINAPTLNQKWEGTDKNDDEQTRKSRNDEKGTGIVTAVNNLANESEPDEHDQEIENQMAGSSKFSYKVIDRSHRSQGSRNNSSGDKIENETKATKNRVESGEKSISEVNQKSTTPTSVTRWRYQEGRNSKRIVKAILRRKPITEETTTDNKKTTQSGTPNNTKTDSSS